MKAGRQTTLRDRAELSGIGVHSGVPVSLTIHPGRRRYRHRFLPHGRGWHRPRDLAPNANAVVATEFATVLGDASGPAVSTVEHIMAALCGMGVDNAHRRDRRARSSGPGRQRRAFRRGDRAGRHRDAAAAAPRTCGCSSRSASTSGNSYAELRPYDRGFRLEIEIDFDHRTVGRQNLALDITPGRSGANSRVRAPSVSCAMSTSCGTPAMRSAPRFDEHGRGRARTRAEPGRPALPGRVRAS